ncbi:hypothetical protein GWO43_18910 [candidate division KSB1 bacterium]|nr:hypothetical protein [candidate division KSB1 bacterium]NIR71026.1 hypothetical protein [candidate division KSB1 bacterium]NIS26111.1 hypothetical protein [candidate division KSB1 bacterium]NIT72905.1 hypothetical protein [candidate division KSB1 bacterium]NIU26750.1 hypothetical protein [candidate division KSB1 bacterium]
MHRFFIFVQYFLYIGMRFFRLFWIPLVPFSATVGSLIILVSGCFNPFAPELDEGQDLTNVITEQQSPKEVLENFQLAYTFKDSLIYSDVLDESFVFEYFDPNLGPSGSFVTWGRDTDLKTTGRLFRTFDVIDLKFLNTIFSEREGGREKRFIRFNLSLFGSEFNFIITGTAIFTFEQSDQDNKWRIVRWKDESDL